MNEEVSFSRRVFLDKAGKRIAAAALAASGLGSIIPRTVRGESSSGEYDFLMTRVKFACTMSVRDNWNVFPGGERNFLEEFRRVVRCRVKLPPNCNDNQPHSGQDSQFNAVVDLSDIEALRKYPFLFMTASGSYDLSKEKRKNLRQYVNEGGFVLMDDCVHGTLDDGDFFYQSSHKILEDAFGAGSIKQIPNSHEIFHNVYDLGEMGLPYIIGKYHGARGIFVDDRLAVFLSSTDIHCGWVDKTGAWFGNGGKMGVGKHGHKEAVQMGINIVTYALSH